MDLKGRMLYFRRMARGGDEISLDGLDKVVVMQALLNAATRPLSWVRKDPFQKFTLAQAERLLSEKGAGPLNLSYTIIKGVLNGAIVPLRYDEYHGLGVARAVVERLRNSAQPGDRPGCYMCGLGSPPNEDNSWAHDQCVREWERDESLKKGLVWVDSYDSLGNKCEDLAGAVALLSKVVSMQHCHRRQTCFRLDGRAFGVAMTRSLGDDAWEAWASVYTLSNSEPEKVWEEEWRILGENEPDEARMKDMVEEKLLTMF